MESTKDCNDCVNHVQGGPMPEECRQCLHITESTFGPSTHLPFFARKGTQTLTESSTKPTNPKDAIGSTKLPLNLVPDSLSAYAALSFAEGASKYGSYNWRVAGVRASIYKAALERHLKKWWNGEECDPVTKVPHLASVIACAAIILDADLAGKMTDDRPPKVPMGELIDSLEPVVKHLYEMHKNKNPYHHTALDRPEAG